MLVKTLRLLLLLALCLGPGLAHAAPMPCAVPADAPLAGAPIFSKTQAPTPSETVRLEPPERHWAGLTVDFEAERALPELPAESRQARCEYQSTHSPLLHLRLCVFLC